MKVKIQSILKKVIGLILGLCVIFLPLIGFVGIKYGTDVYSKKSSFIVDDCVVKSVVEAPKEILFVVEFPTVQNSLVIGGQLHIVHAYGKRDKDKQTVKIGDTVTCAFPERNTRRKGYVVWLAPYDAQISDKGVQNDL